MKFQYSIATAVTLALLQGVAVVATALLHPSIRQPIRHGRKGITAKPLTNLPTDVKRQERA
ncbi:Uncharacterised protein [Vibrio parahaemolyticus]|nr:Uncharacterised protein [Vibrio parahaemolyticus]